MANGNSKVCPLIRQECIKGRCEFFHAALKKCEVSVISYNAFRLAASTKPNPVNSTNGGDLIFGKKPGDETPWDGAAL
jgi:hypothetical protein